MHSAEMMTMTKKYEENIRIFERNILRTIMAPIKLTDNEFRLTNTELEEVITGEDSIKKINRQRIK